MTATIPAKYTNPRSLEIEADGNDVCIRVVNPDGNFVGLRIDPAALLAAISTELNVATRHRIAPSVRHENIVVPLRPSAHPVAQWAVRSSRPSSPGFVEYPDTFPTAEAAAMFAIAAFPCTGQSGAWEWVTVWGSVWVVPTELAKEVAA